MNYQCEHCDQIVDWDTDEIVHEGPVKTIGSRYCVRCIRYEASVNGVSIVDMIKVRTAQGRPVPSESTALGSSADQGA